MDAWRVEVSPKPGLPDPAGHSAELALESAGLELAEAPRARRGYLIGTELSAEQVQSFAAEVLADSVSDEFVIIPPGEKAPSPPGRICILPRSGVTDPVANSLQRTLRDCELPAAATGTYQVYEVPGDHPAEVLREKAEQALANEVIQEVLVAETPLSLPGPGGEADLRVLDVEIRDLDEAALVEISRQGGLALNGPEMLCIQAHFLELGRDPRQIELETIAQTWSEHCKHKTLTGKIRFEGELIDNLLKNSIAAVTKELDRDFCLSVFVDNAGVIAFDDEDAVCIKVETHNHPSAIEPFGGAGTGVGGVIRDVLGTGLAARPVASTDVFCFAPVDMPQAEVPKGCMHPMQLLRGVVAGVRDYGNPMGIPTVNGSVHFDPDFVGNPLVYVGNVGILPRDKVEKAANPGDVILSIGGRTGRDGIHGATFSSLELHSESEMVSSGAVQIGDPITERKAMDAVLRARDAGLFSAITDCGAGGYSSAVGEMAEGLGAEVELAEVPLKYQGLSPWEIWISEAQERMVLAVPPENLSAVLQICAEEDVEANAIGSFNDSGKLILRHAGVLHGELDLEFLHEGLPRTERKASYTAPELTDPELPAEPDLGAALLAVLSDFNVASKEWVIRQYDHEVQAGAAGKPLIGPAADGPADAAVIAPKLGSRRGIVLSNGLNPRYSRIDPAAMAECALDEAMRNLVSAGGDPEFTAILDNYCWGNCEDEERLGGLVRATLALCDLAKTYRTPFVSGKDSLNNEFRDGDRLISIPGCILVSAMGVIPDVTRSMSSDLKQADNLLYLVGMSKRELGGSVYWKTKGELGASVPRVDAAYGKNILDGVARAIQAKAVEACHDLSEGGLGAAIAEMCLAGRLGAEFDLSQVKTEGLTVPAEVLFSESQSRFLLEVHPDKVADLEANLHELDYARIGRVTSKAELRCMNGDQEIFTLAMDRILHAYKHPLDLDGSMTGGQR
ncbi:MAG: phosphoribosylformylglycinamidine synthase subunit PurL [Planctomycetota bacterium]|jgi:phosphoribosylformylglycinamidine synthase